MRNLIRGLTCALFCAVATPIAHGGVVATSRLSTIHVEGVAEADTFEETDTIDAFGPYDNAVSGTAGETAGTNANADASQQSNVDASFIGRLMGTAAGDVRVFAAFDPADVSGPAMARGRSELTVLFQVTDQSEPYRVNGSFAGGFGSIAIELVNVTNPAATTGVFGIFNGDPFTPPEFDEAGNLSPGAYRLRASADTASSGSSPQDPHSFGTFAEFDLAFAVGAEAVIPLPPGVWTGAAGLAAALGANVFIRRRHRA